MTCMGFHIYIPCLIEMCNGKASQVKLESKDEKMVFLIHESFGVCLHSGHVIPPKIKKHVP